MVRRLSRLPIRLRLTLAFATAMAVAFVALFVFIYVAFQRDQASTLDEGLRARLRDLVASADETPPGDLAQVGEQGTRLLTVPEEHRVTRGAVLTISRRAVAGAGDVRIRARRAPGGTPVAVAEPLRLPDRALTRLRALLLIAGPLALVLASFAGYEVAGAALRPVERMRSRAESIEAGDLGERLPPGPADDEVGRLGATLNELLDRLEDALMR